MLSKKIIFPPNTIMDEKLQRRLKRLDKGTAKRIAEFIEQYRNEFNPGDMALELGVGEGRNLPAFNGLNLKLYGMELDPMAIDICHQVIQLQNVVATIIQGSFVDLSMFNSQSFKLVYSQSSIQNAFNLAEVKQVFSEVHRILQHNGIFLFCESRFPRIKDANRATRIAYFTEQEITQLAQEFNFTIEQGDKPIGFRPDLDRVGGQRARWAIVFRKQ